MEAKANHDMKAISDIIAKIPPEVKMDKEIRDLIEEYSKRMETLKLIPKYVYIWATYAEAPATREYANNLILEIASLSDEVVREKYKDINIDYLRRAATRIIKSREPVIQEENTQTVYSKKERYEKCCKSGFYSIGITRQEEFDSFLSELPEEPSWKREQIKQMWEKHKEYGEYDQQQLEDRKEQIKKEFKYINIYREFNKYRIMVDYNKLKAKTLEELEQMLHIVMDDPLHYYNRKNYRVSNPLGDIIIDDEEKADYSKVSSRGRMIGLSRYKHQLDEELIVINSIINFRTTRKEEIENTEQTEVDASDSNIEVEENVSINSEEDYEDLSNEELLELQANWNSKIDETESTISALQTSIDEVDNQIKNEKEKQEAEKRRKLIESIKRKIKIVQEGNDQIENLRRELAEKKQELDTLEKAQNLTEGDDQKDD